MGCGLGFFFFPFWFFFFFFPLFISWAGNTVALEQQLKSLWKRWSLDKRQDQVPSLKYPRTCPGSTLCLVGIKLFSAKPANPRSLEQERQRRHLCLGPKETTLQVTLKQVYSSQELAGCISSAFLFFLLLFFLDQTSSRSAGPGCPACPNASHLWKGSFR